MAVGIAVIIGPGGGEGFAPLAREVNEFSLYVGSSGATNEIDVWVGSGGSDSGVSGVRTGEVEKYWLSALDCAAGREAPAGAVIVAAAGGWNRLGRERMYRSPTGPFLTIRLSFQLARTFDARQQYLPLLKGGHDLFCRQWKDVRV